MPVTPDAAEIVYQDIFIDTDDGLKLHGWKLFADKAWLEQHSEGRKSGTILFFHGNGDNVSTQLPNTFWLAKKGYDLYVFDYRGYGLSQGEVDLDATISDMALMTAHVMRKLSDNDKLIIIGHSLGGSMAIYTVAHSKYKSRVAALITVGAFSDYHDVAQDVLAKTWFTWPFQWPLSFTIDNSYRPLDSIGLVSPVPVLIIQGKNDEIIGIEHAEKLFEAAKPPKTFKVIDSDHNNIFISNENRQVLLDYLQTLSK